MSVQGKRVLITGASSGIGEVTARAFVRGGAEVIITSEREQDLLRVAEELRNSGGKVTPIVVDFTKPEQVAGFWAQAEAKAGGAIEILVNNAGVGLGAKLHEITDRQMRFVMEVNFFAMFSLSQQALIAMRERKQGRIINITSSTARIGLGGVSAYSASKGACHTLTAALRQEAYSSGIFVTEVLPISVNTPFFNNVGGEKYRPTGIVQTPEHVAQCILRCAEARHPRAEVLPYRPVRLAFIADAILPGIVDRVLRKRRPQE
jgi:3-oxoacyl-[acyl-carrier protein] reductase/2-[hydroxy(phenyl)methyl]-succinyl-CoA dehydrogenase BbsD subunit